MIFAPQGQWLIWSNKHLGWWQSDKLGYTGFKKKAARYTFEEAFKIVNDGNKGLKDEDEPNESMIYDIYDEK